MGKPSVLKEEILYYITEEWNESLKTYNGGKWLTTRAIMIKLKNRGIITTWPTLSLRLAELKEVEQVEKIYTSNGICWKPVTDTITI